ncbi:MAG: 2-dehydropantoate 2-reductase [Alphaproteobacteria bacterium]|nr:MAG: 2-dehydropantoate 2-reductase [Alphaproteobacteria bacterium]
MRICVVGAGAIGGLMGAKLALSGQEVTLIDQGAHLAAIKENGLKLVMEDGAELLAKDLKATDSFDEAGTQDMVILALKAHQIEAVAPKLPALFDADTSIVTVQNGLPWWYFQRHGGEFDGRRLETLDPTGVIEANIEAERIIGCVVYPAAAVIEPGVIHHVEGDRFPVGELDGSESERAKTLCQTLIDAGFRSRVVEDIRSEIWLKAWGNLSFNPISALTHATLLDICRFPEARTLAANMMKEAQEIAEKLGIEFRHTIERRIEGAEAVGAHKTSMLQDVEARRSLEVEALIGAVIELARLTNTPSPSIDAVCACVKLLDKTLMRD